MIRITDKKDCCGCHACASVCARHSITMQEDNEGFLYPVVDTSTCTDCGLCEKVCPVINQDETRKPLKVYAAKNRNEEIRRQSSSGGIFTPLAEAVIRDGGVVFGAKFDKDWNVVHAWTDTIEGIADFRGSKYVQSTIGDTYREAREFLKQGRKVLFSGTPCQIAGLRKFLRKEYDNLLTVDVVCHGCPSPGVFRWYMSEELQKIKSGKICKDKCLLPSFSEIPSIDILAKNEGMDIKQINFRDKSTGWKSYSFRLEYQLEQETETYAILGSKNSYMRGFLSDLFLRPSCYDCPAKAGKSGADITLGDFWGIQRFLPEIDDDLGISAIMLNTKRSEGILLSIQTELYKSNYDDICLYNPSLIKSSELPIERTKFYNKAENNFHTRVSKYEKIYKPPFIIRIKVLVYNILQQLKMIHHS